MGESADIVIVGASARAAAFSALRAGLRPWCADLFADADLRARCPVRTIAVDRYPRAFAEIIRGAPPGPWMFVGGLENRPELVGDIARERSLWGSPPEVLRVVRDPFHLARVFPAAGISFPEVRHDDVTPSRQWLIKPRDGAGGVRIQFHRPGQRSIRRRSYLQEFLEGPSWSAVYVATAEGAMLLGISQQLVGEPWLNARPFQYCGSVAPPFGVSALQQSVFQRLGVVLARTCGIRGLFGVDCVLRDGAPWPVEVNPRYTASVEAVEFAQGLSALALHRQVFDPSAPTDCSSFASAGPVVGKAILFARRKFAFPDDGPWLDVLRPPPTVDELPLFADIPVAGQDIEEGWPVLTFFATAKTVEECLARLRQIAENLDHWLYKR